GGILLFLQVAYFSNVLYLVGSIFSTIELCLFSIGEGCEITPDRPALPGILERIARHPSLRYIFKKSVIIGVELFLVATFNFFIVNLYGSPVSLFIRPGITRPEDVQRIYEALGLNQPILIRYVKYLFSEFQFDFGVSFFWRKPVSALIYDRLIPTLILMGSSLIFSSIIGIVLGILAGLAPHSRRDSFLTNTSIVLTSFPTFWLGIVLVYIFSLLLGWFPISHMYTVGVVYTPEQFWEMVVDILWHLFLPMMTLVLVSIAGLLVLMRDSIMQVSREDYVLVARAKGLPERTVLTRYILRNSMLPVVTVIALSIGFILSGAVITEQIFDWPGLGKLYFEAVLNNDYPVVLGLLFLTSFLVLIMSLVVDLLYVILDPRIKFQ
ncbi:MAG: ABC transporter permease, partial [Candidatus Korarchaeota archaeon]